LAVTDWRLRRLRLWFFALSNALPSDFLGTFRTWVWKDTQAQNSLPEAIFSTLKTALKIQQKNVKTRKIDNILKTARNIAKS